MESRLSANLPEEIISGDGRLISRAALLDQLERVLESRHFRNSKRYPAFLRYVVEHTLSGESDDLKERTLGVEVFSRDGDYDTNADPIVRVTAGEVRKRIAQYYQEPGHEHEVRIDLPLGGYVPHFFRGTESTPLAEEPTTVSAPERSLDSVPEEGQAGVPVLQSPTDDLVAAPLRLRSTHRRGLVLRAGAITLAVLCLGLIGWWRVRAGTTEPGVDVVWKIVMNSREPVLNVIGVHTLDRFGNEIQPASHAGGAGEPSDMLSAMVRSDMVPISDIVSDSRVMNLLTRHAHPYTILGSADATLEQVRAGPLVLVGGLDNIWTLRLTSKLRFRFNASAQSESSIVDSEHPEKRWTFDNLQRPVGSTVDYAIVASYFDKTIDQPVVVLAGIGKTGTLVASEFATSDTALREWLSQSHRQGQSNVEIVLATEILDGKAGPPRVVASAFW